MKIKVSILLAMISVLVISSKCKKDKLDDKLSLSKIFYVGNGLRTDGYFFQQKDGYYYTLYCFYKNGIILYLGGGYSQNDIVELEAKIRDGRFYNFAKNTKDYWGVFQIIGYRIQFERWYPSSGGSLPAYIRTGLILNDTTFYISLSTRSNGSEASNEKETYHFKKFSPKPDSTNSFIP